MSGIKALTRHPVLTYFALTFAISWGGVLLAIGRAGGIPDTRAEFEAVFPFAVVAMLAGPSASGTLLTGLVHGRAGFRDLLSRLARWQVGVRWYAVALLTAPLVIGTTLLGLSFFSPAFTPGILATDDPASRMFLGIAVGLGAGVLEEIGWMGFAVPMLLVRHRVLTTGLAVGVLWGAWHIAGTVVLASGTYAGTLPLPVFLVTRIVGLLVGTLAAFRVLMVWVYARTGSLLAMMLMHVSLTASTLVLEPVAIGGVALLVYDMVSIVTWWTVVALIVLADRGLFLATPEEEAGIANNHVRSTARGGAPPRIEKADV
jgi:membrane protease YdiL (CAAX protease family)